MKQVSNIVKFKALAAAIALLSGCSSMSNVLNPFHESPAPEAMLGEKNDHALNGEGEKVDRARAALESMSQYRRALPPQPSDPVMQPAVVRLMWVPDHLNKSGDLVPAHYYYLKVLSDRWAVQDAFELEGQLGKKSDASSIPFTTKDDIEGSR